jgi:hypothetical protein
LVSAVAAGRRDTALRRGKMFGRPQIVFLRENLVRRVGRRSLQFSAPTSECRSRAPTNGGCPRSCPVHSASWPDSREFLALEMEVVGRRAHIWGQSFALSKRRALLFPRLDANTNHYIFAARANFASSSENAFARGIFIFAPEGESAFHSKTCLRTILSYYPGEYSLPI